MVRFKEESFTITVYTGGDPVEEWMHLHDDLCELLKEQNEDYGEKRWWVCNLLKELTPEWTAAKKMAE
jgi:hypothetical protein